MMELESFLIIIIPIGIGTLLSMSMLIPNLPVKSDVLKGSEHRSSSFSRGFFIGMLFPILVFILLGMGCFLFCTESSYSVKDLLPLLSVLGILWLSIVAIKYLIPLFIGKLNFDTTSYHPILGIRTTKIRRINLANYITYILLFGILLFLLFFVDTAALSEVVIDFFKDFGWEAKLLNSPYFSKTISWIFYILVLSALIGMLATLKMLGREMERRGNEELQAKKLYDFISKNFKI